MKKSFMLVFAFCGVLAVLVAPGMAQANGCPSGDTCPVMTYRSFESASEPQPWTAALADIIGTSPLTVVKQESPETIYHPAVGAPGYIYGSPNQGYSLSNPPPQWTYVIDIPSPVGGTLFNVEGAALGGPPGMLGLDGGDIGVGGVLVLSNYFYDGGPGGTPVPLPPTSQWDTPTFLSEVEAVVVFDTGNSAVLTYEHDGVQVPEPGVLFLLGSGLIGLVGMRRAMKK